MNGSEGVTHNVHSVLQAFSDWLFEFDGERQTKMVISKKPIIYVCLHGCGMTLLHLRLCCGSAYEKHMSL
jgi:hypothetical protein